MANVEQFYLVSLTETFIDNNVDLSGVFVDYVKFVCPALKLSYHGRRSGGVLVLVKKHISWYKKSKSAVRIIMVLKLSGDINYLVVTGMCYTCQRMCRRMEALSMIKLKHSVI